jgi:hypothetical protein
MTLAVWLCAEPSAAQWTQLAAGVEYQARPFDHDKPKAVLEVVRVDPNVATLQLGMASKDGRTHTAGAWTDQLGWVASINAGMFSTDHKSNVGKLVDGAHVNNGKFNDYQSALVFNPKKAGLPKAQLLDLDDDGAKDVAAQYGTVVQNLRLMKGQGTSVWKPNGRAWSEAAVAQDKQGRILFLFVHEGYQMSEFNRLLLAAGLDVVRAMHVEGGPEASLSLRGKVQKDYFGSYETGFFEKDTNDAQWELPNVLGVK